MITHFNLTKSFIDDIIIPKKMEQYADTKTPYLRLLVFPSGVKTFILYRKVKGRPQRIKIGRCTDLTLEQARKEATRLNSLIALGHNPMLDRLSERKEITIKDLCLVYYDEHCFIHNKRPNDVKKTLDLHIVPRIGKLKGVEFTQARARNLNFEIANENGKGAANKAMALLNAAINFGIRHGYFNHANPCTGLAKFKSKSRDRFLSKSELKAFFTSLLLEPVILQDYFSMLLYTGARRTNVLQMKWSDIDFDLSRWRIQESEAKNGCVNIVYLSAEAIQILSRRLENNSEDNVYVFPGTGKAGHLVNPQKAFKRIRERMKVLDIRIHDLRRTFASYMAISGASLPTIGAALNHKSPASTIIYARLSADAVKYAIDQAVNQISMHPNSSLQ